MKYKSLRKPPAARRGAPARLSPTASLFTTPGEMAELCRKFDWAGTPLGPISEWSQSLRTTADAVIACRHPMLLWWGPELIQLYNDALRPSLGESTDPSARHPRALGMRAADCWTEMWYDIEPQVRGVMQRGETVWFEDRYAPIQRNGKLDDAWWTYGYSPVRDDDGSIGGALIVSTETTRAVTARRQVDIERARAESILQSMADGYVLLDSEFRFVAANRSMVRGSGIPLEQLIGRMIWDVFPGARGNEWERNFRRVAAERTEMHFTLPYKDDKLDLMVDADIYPALEGGTVAFWRNVTQRERASAERERLLAGLRAAFEHAEEARDAAEEANRAKSNFLAMMSHELRTPLNAIAGYVQLLDMGVHGTVSQEQRGVLTRIQRSQRHLLGLINTVLSYAKIDAGKLKYNIEKISMDDVLRTSEALILPEVRNKGLRFHNPGRSAGVTARADREKVQQVILNLLSNAVKFTDTGGHVTVDCATKGGLVVVTVTDTGRGIAPDKLESAFQPFVQVDTKFTRGTDGMGLGLTISRDLARGMGGNLTVESQVGVGSTFTVTLPASESDSGSRGPSTA